MQPGIKVKNYMMLSARTGAAHRLLFCKQADYGARRRALRKQSGGTHYIKKVFHRTLIFQVLCCFLLFLLHFCHMALEACFHIFGVKRFDDTYAVVVDVDNLIPLSVKVVGG